MVLQTYVLCGYRKKKMRCSRDMVLFAYHEDPRRFLLTEHSPTVLDRTSNEYVKRLLQQTIIALQLTVPLSVYLALALELSTCT